jgi:hypothetical protein
MVHSLSNPHVQPKIPREERIAALKQRASTDDAFYRDVFHTFQEKKRLPYQEAIYLSHEFLTAIDTKKLDKWVQFLANEKTDLTIDDWCVAIELMLTNEPIEMDDLPQLVSYFAPLIVNL